MNQAVLNLISKFLTECMNDVYVRVHVYCSWEYDVLSIFPYTRTVVAYTVVAYTVVAYTVVAYHICNDYICDMPLLYMK